MSLRYGLLRTVKTVTIADNASLSDAVHCNGLTLAALIVPSGWVAADVTFQASVDGTNWFNLYHAGSDTEFTAEAAASRYIAVNRDNFRGVSRLKVRSGTAAAAVSQTGGPLTITLIFTD